MEFLYLLEELRTPWLDAVVSAVTHLGGETVFLVAALAVFWCVDKTQGYYLMSVGFLGTLANQFLKISCRIPRPWVRDPDFSIVESARAEATGYSFPSGHSTSSVGVFGVLATEVKTLWLRLVCVALCFVVPFSRMYLGVHTPADVLVGSAISLFFIIVLRPLIFKENGKYLPRLLGVMLALSMAFVGYVELYPFPVDVDRQNLHSAVSNSYTLLGSLLGMLVAYHIDQKRNFSTEGVWYVQVLKLLLGLLVVAAVKKGLELPLDLLFGGHQFARTVQYFAVVVTAGVLWPTAFPMLAALGRKEKLP